MSAEPASLLGARSQGRAANRAPSTARTEAARLRTKKWIPGAPAASSSSHWRAA